MIVEQQTDREALFQPLRIRGVELRNRIVMSPMTRGFCPDGVPAPNVAAYYGRRSEGGAGLIVTEGIAVDHPAAVGDAGLGEDNIPLLGNAASVDGWRKVVAAVHAHGGKIIPQLWHQGAMRKPNTGPHPHVPSVSPSGIWGPLGRMTSIDPKSIPADPRIGEAMGEAEIEGAISAFVRSAVNAVDAGFDGIALHGGHGYLLDNFLWEGTNQRDDKWGGSRARRSEFPAEIVRRIRAAIGEDLPFFFRFSQWKQQDFRATLADNPDELREVLQPLADAGVDVFDASVRYYNRAAFDGDSASLAGVAKRVTGKMSMAVGGVGINSGMYDRDKPAAVVSDFGPLLERFKAGEFDLVAVGRAMIGDPHWARKFREGQPTEPYRMDADNILS